MGSEPWAAFASRFVRGRRFDRNPLRRSADRAETIVLALLLVAFLVGAPLAALASGAWAHAMAQRAELAQTASARRCGRRPYDARRNGGWVMVRGFGVAGTLDRAGRRGGDE